MVSSKESFNSEKPKRSPTKFETFFKNLFSPKTWEQWIKEGLEDLGYSILGNLLPLWAMIISNFINDGPYYESLYDALHQPFTYVILSGTYLSSTFYLESKPEMGNKIFKFIFAFFFVIIGLLVAKKPILDDLTAPFYLELMVVIIFLICFFIHMYFLFRSHYKRLNIKTTEIIKKEKKKLDDEFDKTK